MICRCIFTHDAFVDFSMRVLQRCDGCILFEVDFVHICGLHVEFRRLRVFLSVLFLH